jgi:hypothetical protein
MKEMIATLIQRAFCAAWTIVFFSASVPACLSQTPPVSLDFTVRKSPGVDKNLTTDDVQKILAKAAAYLNVEMKRLTASEKSQQSALSLPDPPEVNFSLRGQVLDLAPLTDSAIQGGPFPEAVADIKDSERTGLYILDAVASRLVTDMSSNDLQIVLVKKILTGCPPASVLGLPPIQPQGDADHWYGCTLIHGAEGVLRLIKNKPKSSSKYDSWIASEGLLWAHEIGHILGLFDIDPHLSPALPLLTKQRWLMESGIDMSSTRLLGEECVVVTRYPNNGTQQRQLFRYLYTADQRTQPSSTVRPTRLPEKNDCR